MREWIKTLKKNGKEKTAWFLIWALLVEAGMAGIRVTSFAEERTAATDIDITDTARVSPEKAFSRIRLRTSGVADGKFSLQVDAALDNGEGGTLSGIYEEALGQDADLAAMADEDFDQVPDGTLAPVYFEFDVTGDEIKAVFAPGNLSATGDLLGTNAASADTYHKKVGDYAISQTASGITIAFHFRKSFAYRYSDVTAGYAFNFQAEGASDGDDIDINAKPNGVVELTIVGAGGGSDKPGNDGRYRIEKAASSSVTEPEIVYQITASTVDTNIYQRRSSGRASSSTLRAASGSSYDGGYGDGGHYYDGYFYEDSFCGGTEDLQGEYPEEDAELFDEWQDDEEDLTFEEWMQKKLGKRKRIRSFRRAASGAGERVRAGSDSSAGSPSVMPLRGTGSDVSEPGDLAGKWILDELPAGLELKEVWLGGMDGSGKKLAESDYKGNGDGTLLKYQIASSSDASAPGTTTDGARITGLTLTVVARLTDGEMQKFKGGQGYERIFKNTAILKDRDGGDGKQLADSGEITTEMKIPKMFEKDGKAYGLNGDIFQWTLKLRTFLRGGVESAYVVDWINDAHRYTDEGLDVKEGDALLDNVAPAPSGQTFDIGDSVSPDDWLGTQEGQNALEGLMGDAAGGAKYFTFQDQSGKTYDAFAFSVKNYMNRDITIEYKTAIVKPGAGDGIYTGKKKLDNWAKFLYKAGGGVGPGDWEIWAALEKGFTVFYDVVTKNAGTGGASYKKETQEMCWEFEVNKIGKALNNIKIVDTFDTASQQILPKTFDGTGDDAKISLICYNRDTEAEVSGSNKVLSKDAGLTATMSDAPGETAGWNIIADGSRRTLVLQTGPVHENEYYKVKIYTRVVDPAILSRQGEPAPALKNKANYQIYGSTGPILSAVPEIAATQKIPNTLIQKDTAAFQKAGGGDYYYDYEKNQVKWRITTNPNHIMIQDQTITDTLPTGVTFAGITKAEMTPRPAAGGTGAPIVGATASDAPQSFKFQDGGRTVVLTLTEEDDPERSSEADYPHKLLKFKFSQESGGNPVPYIAGDSFQFEFLTDVDETYRKDHFKSGGAGTATEINLTNMAALGGDAVALEGGDTGQVIPGAVRPIDVSDDAKNVARVPPVKKNGTYLPDGGYVDWQLLVNRTKTDFTSAKITDELKEWFDLNLESGEGELTFYKLDSIGPDGEDRIDPKTDPRAEKIENPEAVLNLHAANTGFDFTVPAALSREILLVTYRTYLTDTAEAEDIVNSVKVERAGNSDSTADQEADHSGKFDLEQYATGHKILMLVIEKISKNDAGKKIPLPGAEFRITPVKLVNGSYVEDEDKKKEIKTKTTNSQGKAVFLRLKRDVVYRLEEKTAPPGYDKLEPLNPNYIMFPGTTAESDYPDGVFVIPGDKNQVFTYTCTINNSPLDGGSGKNELLLKKVGSGGTALQGAVFTLKHESGAMKERTADSDENGLVRFASLDPGTYIVEEKTPPRGYLKAPGTLTVTVALDQSGQYEDMVLTPENGFPYTAAAAGASNPGGILGTVTDEPVKSGDVEAVKQSARLGKGGAEVTAPLAGARFELKATPDAALYSETADSGQDGTVHFSKVPLGTYVLREIQAPEGYLLPSGAGGLPREVTVEDQRTSTEDTSGETLVFDNEPIGFEVRLQKVDEKGTALPGAVFVLQKKEGGRTEDLCRLTEEPGGAHRLPDPGKEPGQILLADPDEIWNYFLYSGKNGAGEPSGARLYYSGAHSYQVVERTAPDGYEADAGVYEIDRDAALRDGTAVIANDGSGGFANRPKSTPPGGGDQGNQDGNQGGNQDGNQGGTQGGNQGGTHGENHGGGGGDRPPGNTGGPATGPGKEPEAGAQPEKPLPSETQPEETQPETEGVGDGEREYVIVDPGGKEIYRSRRRPGDAFLRSLPQGTYEILTEIGDMQIPTGRFQIMENGELKRLPKLGERGNESRILWLMLGACACCLAVCFRRQRARKKR